MQIQELIDKKLIKVSFKDDDVVSYCTKSKVKICYKGENVYGIDVLADGVVMVITVQGRDRLGEFEFKIDDDIDLEVFTKHYGK